MVQWLLSRHTYTENKVRTAFLDRSHLCIYAVIEETRLFFFSFSLMAPTSVKEPAPESSSAVFGVTFLGTPFLQRFNTIESVPT